jgi:uncharacterized peroxidase-related enzyme
MLYQPISALPIIEEDEATGEIAEIFASIRREFGFPYIPNVAKTLAVSPAALYIFCDITRTFEQRTTLPQSLISMILYSVAKSNDCKYCSATNELACRTLGVDEAALETLVEDLPNFTPQRVRIIIEFALKVAHDRQNLVAEDYNKLRAQGISDAELVEIILIAAHGVFNDTVADALKIDVDHEVAEALGR